MNSNHEIIIQKLQAFVAHNIKGQREQRLLVEYVSTLVKNDAVIILDFEHLSQLLGIKSGVLASIINKPSAFYYTFRIPKRSGGERQISSPYPVLLNAQRWIYENLLLPIGLHECSKGFVKNRSIVDNAREHLTNKKLLKMDIKDFFPSITINRVISIFRRLGYTKKVSYYLASICCLNNTLPQGAATSPAISNIIAKRMDRRLFGFANKFGLTYTRYADDLTFSGESIPPKLINYIELIAKDEGFCINEKKTKLLSENKQKIVTGISISSGKMTIPKKAKREIRKNIYHVLTKGLPKHQKAIGSDDPIYIERLLGYLFFWLSVEPENQFVIKSIKDLKEYSATFFGKNKGLYI